MKFFVLLFVLVAVTMMVDARPSKEANELKEELETNNQAEKSKRHIGLGRMHYRGWDTSVNTAHASASAHVQTGHHHHNHHHLPHISAAHSEAHSISANVNLPHSSVSIAHSEAHQQTMG